MKKSVVLAKQVPDTANVGSEAMKEDGTVNRAALKAIFNPEDLNALEMALQVKERLGHQVHVLSMGPASAVAVLRHALYMGADAATLLSDRRFAGADTLATSLVLAAAIRKLGDVEFVFAGRQAIDGDTAQVGPQVASLLGFNLVAFVSGLREVTAEHVTVERDAETQTEVIRASCPVVLTVMGSANTPRYPNAHRQLRHFRADLQENFKGDALRVAEENGWVIPVWDRAALGLEEEICGLKGSPTKVHSIKNITLAGRALEMYPREAVGIKALVRDIMKEYTEV